MTIAKETTVFVMLMMLTGLIAACEQNDPSTSINPPVNTSTNQPSNTAVDKPVAVEPTHSNEPAAAYEVLAGGLRVPWVIAFDGDTIYISEREGNIVRVDGKETKRQSVHLLKNVTHQGEGGLLGLLLAPDFKQSRLAYAYHTYEEKGELFNRVVLIKQNGDQWDEVKALIEGIPGSSNHDGGRMAIGTDELLYITTGDAQQRELAQDLNSLAGKILRMTQDGSVPDKNPFPGSYVYSYGHRNPQGLAWDANGVMWSSEHGPSGVPGGHDEINKIVAGGNYGWPTINGDEQRKGMIVPIYHTGEIAIAPSGMTVDANNRLLIATLLGSSLYRFDPETNVMEVLFEGEGRLRDVKMKGDNIYVITNNTDGRGTPSDSDDRLLLLNRIEQD